MVPRDLPAGLRWRHIQQPARLGPSFDRSRLVRSGRFPTRFGLDQIRRPRPIRSDPTRIVQVPFLERPDRLPRPLETQLPRLQLADTRRSAMSPRTKLSASRCIATSLRTISGLLPLNTSIRIVVFNDLRSNSFYQP